MLVSAESQVPKLISREIIFPDTNACDHNPPTSQTDGRTDGQTTYHGNTALRYASRGKNWQFSTTFSHLMPSCPIGINSTPV